MAISGSERGVFMIRVVALVFMTACVCPAVLHAQENAGQGWGVAEPRQRPAGVVSLVAMGSSYDVARPASGALGVPLGQNNIAEESQPPFPVLMPKAIVYPRKAVRKGWEGQAVVAAEVLPDGSVGRTALAKSSGHEVLDQAAQDAIQSWKFENESEKD